MSDIPENKTPTPSEDELKSQRICNKINLLCDDSTKATAEKVTVDEIVFILTYDDPNKTEANIAFAKYCTDEINNNGDFGCLAK